MAGTIKMFCIRMNILSHRNNIELFLPCNMAAMQNLYREISYSSMHIFGIISQMEELLGPFKIGKICMKNRPCHRVTI